VGTVILCVDVVARDALICCVVELDCGLVMLAVLVIALVDAVAVVAVGVVIVVVV
jgi:hypothetical protein